MIKICKIVKNCNKLKLYFVKCQIINFQLKLKLKSMVFLYWSRRNTHSFLHYISNELVPLTKVVQLGSWHLLRLVVRKIFQYFRRFMQWLLKFKTVDYPSGFCLHYIILIAQHIRQSIHGVTLHLHKRIGPFM